MTTIFDPSLVTAERAHAADLCQGFLSGHAGFRVRYRHCAFPIAPDSLLPAAPCHAPDDWVRGIYPDDAFAAPHR